MMWNRDNEVIIVLADMSAIFVLVESKMVSPNSTTFLSLSSPKKK